MERVRFDPFAAVDHRREGRAGPFGAVVARPREERGRARRVAWYAVPGPGEDAEPVAAVRVAAVARALELRRGGDGIARHPLSFEELGPEIGARRCGVAGARPFEQRARRAGGERLVANGEVAARVRVPAIAPALEERADLELRRRRAIEEQERDPVARAPVVGVAPRAKERFGAVRILGDPFPLTQKLSEERAPDLALPLAGGVEERGAARDVGRGPDPHERSGVPLLRAGIADADVAPAREEAHRFFPRRLARARVGAERDRGRVAGVAVARRAPLFRARRRARREGRGGGRGRCGRRGRRLPAGDGTRRRQ